MTLNAEGAYGRPPSLCGRFLVVGMAKMRCSGLVALGLLLLVSTARAEPRIALLIGNQSYAAEIGPLVNTHTDVTILGNVLKQLGFRLTIVRDAGLARLHQELNAYARQLRQAGPDAVGFLYYSGHGAANGGINYLIPVDVQSSTDPALWDQSLRLTEITHKLRAEAGNATHFVIFDACRNNLNLRKVGTRALLQPKGFVPVHQEPGMLIAYSTAENELASDAGIYAKLLAEEIVKPDIEAVAMFRVVQRRTRAAINQEPWLGFSAIGDIYLASTDNGGDKRSTPEITFKPCTTDKSFDPGPDTFLITVVAIEEDDTTLQNILKEAQRTGNKDHAGQILAAVRDGKIRSVANETLTLRIKGVSNDTLPISLPYLAGERICKGTTRVDRSYDGVLVANIPILTREYLGHATLALPRQLLQKSPNAQLCIEPSFTLAYPTERRQNMHCDRIGPLHTAASDGTRGRTSILIRKKQ